MRLRTQLLLVSIMTLALPWAGCQYVREMERAQRQGVEEALLASAAVVADALAARPDALYPYLELRTAARDPGRDIYATRIDETTQLDGYADPWVDRAGYVDAPVSIEQSQEAPAADAATSAASSLQVSYAAAVDRHYLDLLIRVRDDDVVYIDPLLGDLAMHDRVLVALEAPDGFTQRYEFATAAPGAFSPADASNGATAGRLRAYWQSVPHGYQLELRAPLGLIGARFGFAVVDADAMGDVATAGTLRGLSETATPHFEGTPGLLVYAPSALRSSLATFAPSDRRLRVTDKSGFELASVGALAPLDEADPDDEGAASGGALAVFYRLLLDRDIAPPPSDPRTGRAAAPGVQSALAGRAAADWYRPAEGSKAIVAAAQPIRAGGELLGAVVLEQTSDAILTLTNHALVRLVNVTLLASLAAAAALLGYATWLSLRIRGLRNAAERALDARGRIAVDLPEVRAGDELGDLARGFAVLLGRLREHTDYLQTLASKLSHELRTPLAVVQSSLENLTQHPLESQAAVYADRAQEGTARLRAILTAMSEATRVEQSIRGVQLERFDVCELLRGAVAAYRDVYRDRRIELALPDSPCELGGAPELLVQMLDKLVENAVDFTAPGGRIDVSLADSRESFRLSVANEGPPLPARMQGRIFDSLVSVREQRGERPHLGLGLHIARLIADAHGATIEANDLPDGRGVEFTVTFPRT